MDRELNPVEIRILGCLLEKEIATPDYYPLTLSALQNACNQKSNRSPVLLLNQQTLEATLYELRTTHHLAVEVSTSGSRVSKYKHCLPDRWNFTPAQTALICELFVRGPQTPGDLRAHASRLFSFSNSSEVEAVLHELEQHEDEPYVVQLPREPGKRERRWAHLFSGEPDLDIAVEHIKEVITEAEDSKTERIEKLEEEVATLRRELDEFKATFNEFRTAFE